MNGGIHKDIFSVSLYGMHSTKFYTKLVYAKNWGGTQVGNFNMGMISLDGKLKQLFFSPIASAFYVWGILSDSEKIQRRGVCI